MRAVQFGMVAMTAMLAAPAVAQDADPGRVPSIMVTGNGIVSTVPDRARIDYRVSGEGKTADAASSALAARQTAIVAGLSGFLGGKTMVTAGDVVVIEARNPLCVASGGYQDRPVLSEGKCAPAGYVATLQGSAQTDRVDKAGTAVGLAGRLGARDARLQGFTLTDASVARRAATAGAIADAQEQAAALASASGAKLGPVLLIRDSARNDYDQIVVTAQRVMAPAPPPAPLPPVEIAIKPRPIETRAQVYVTYALIR